MKKKAKQFISGIMVVLLLLALTGCGEKRKYDEAKELYNAGDYRAAANIFEELGTYEDSASMLQSCEYELTTDRQFIHALSKGLHERWILAGKNKQAAETVVVDGEELRVGDDYAQEVYIEAELDDLIEYKTAVFADKELKGKALAYIAALEEGVEAEKYANVDYTKYYTMTDEVYAERATLLADFYNNYDLQVAAEDASIMKEFLDTAEAVLAQQQEELARQQKEEEEKLAQKQKEEEIKELIVNNFKYDATNLIMKYGSYTIDFSYEFENNSPYDIEGLYAEFYYFDEDGNKTVAYTNILTDVLSGDTLRGKKDLFLLDALDDPYAKPTGTVKMTAFNFWADDMYFENCQKWFE